MQDPNARESARSYGKPLQLALSAGQSQPNKLPGLLSVLRMLPNELGEELKNLVHKQPQIRLAEVGAATFQEAGNVLPSGAIGVLWAERWRQRLYMIFDPTVVELLIEAGVGGETPRALRADAGGFTRTELAILDVFFKRFARALTNAFSLLVDVTFSVLSSGSEVGEDDGCRPAAAVISAKIEFEWLGARGTVAIVIPQAALEPVRGTLASGAVTESRPAEVSSPENQEWTRKLTEEIARAFVTLYGVLEQRAVPFGVVQAFRVGGTVPLESRSISTIRLDVEERPAFWCELGKAGGEFSLRIERPFDPDEQADVDI